MRPFDESDLIAYHLHELPSQRVRELLQAFQKDPSLVAESRSIAAMLAEYKHHTPTDMDPHAFERNWQAVRHALPRVPVAASPFFRWRLPAFAGAGLALAVPIFLLVRHPRGPELKQRVPAGTVADAAIPTSPALPAPSGPSNAASAITDMPLPNTHHGNSRTGFPATTMLHPATTETQHALQTGIKTANPSMQSVADSTSVSTTRVTPSTPPSVSASATQSSSVTDLGRASDTTEKKQATRNASHHATETDLTISVGGTFTAKTGNTVNSIKRSESAVPGVTLIGSFHQQFKPLVGYRVTVSSTRSYFRYDNFTGSGSTSSQYISGRIYEVAGTYVIRGPSRGRVSTYVEAGAGFMAILPTFTDTGNDFNISPAGVVGVSADVPLTKHFGIHAAYRAQGFKGPDFHANPAIYPLANSKILISQEPSVGITYRFSQKQQ